MTNQWNRIDGYQNYSVSTYGDVRNDITKRVLKKGKTTKGYFQVCLSINGIRNVLLVHRLVASAFLKNIEGAKVVNHIDGNKLNNKLSNLEWVSQSRNIKHYHSEIRYKNNYKLFDTDEFLT